MNNNLKKYRNEKGLTLAQLSKKTNLSAGYLCHLENGGRVNPSHNTMLKISNVLNKSVNDIFFEIK